MTIHTLMLGWEFPPVISGGLGTACYGLTKAMDQLGMSVTFVLPGPSTPMHFGPRIGLEPDKAAPSYGKSDFVNIRFRTVSSTLRPYAGNWTHAHPSSSRNTSVPTSDQQRSGFHGGAEEPASPTPYGVNLQTEVRRYTRSVCDRFKTTSFDLVHAHDWMTFPAAVAVTEETGRPLVVHVHSTEFDRSGEHVNQEVYDIERQGMHAANKIITVSNYTRNILVGHYGVASEKVEVVYNGVDLARNGTSLRPEAPSSRPDKTVLFLGRITMQKGPEYFLRAAQKLLERMGNVRFVMAGDGDMLYRSIELAAELGIGQRVFFTRFLRGEAVDRAYQMADLYVMPSVSEPFGIAPLEALQHDVPVLISKQSGIAERLDHALKVDFWDIDEMSNKMAGVLKHPPLQQMMRSNGRSETLKFQWIDAAARINEIYRNILRTE